MNGARDAIKGFKSIFGPNNFFLEIQPNGLEIQNKVDADLKKLSRIFLLICWVIILIKSTLYLLKPSLLATCDVLIAQILFMNVAS